MSETPACAHLTSRALVAVTGEDRRTFLQGLLTQDVATLAPGELRYGALLSPQGRLLFDLFILGRPDGYWLDVAADRRESLVRRLTMYRLRAKVEISVVDARILALFPEGPRPGGWAADPRLPALGLRGYGLAAPEDAAPADESDYEARRLALGVPATADFGEDATWPIEADFDLLNGIDFHKGCFVGQEITSRMKRRGQVRSRMLPIDFDGPPPPFGAEVLAGDLRAGQVLSGAARRAIALLRLDRIAGAALTVGGRPVAVVRPDWMAD
ncbi:MAG: YgfZ/GcvT domain-containing protein [Pseudomonadota bacterium]